ncbi:MAG TPA: hypothetical protein VID19_00225 [Candidatus Eremiobacteraceae bacterium]
MPGTEEVAAGDDLMAALLQLRGDVAHRFSRHLLGGGGAPPYEYSCGGYVKFRCRMIWLDRFGNFWIGKFDSGAHEHNWRVA